VSGRDFTDDELAAAMLGTLFLLERAKELERVALDQGRSREVRQVAADYAVAIRKELR
jgi:phage gp46-like protein